MTDTGIVNFVHPHPPHCLYYTISRYSGAESPCFHICMSLWNWRSVVVWVWKSFEKYLEEQGTHKSVAVCRKIHIFLPFEQITMLNLTCHLGAICTSGMIGKLFTPTFYAYITYIYLTQFTKYTDTNGISSQFKCANLCALHMHSTLYILLYDFEPFPFDVFLHQISPKYFALIQSFNNYARLSTFLPV